MAMFTSAEFTAMTGTTLETDTYTLLHRLAAGIVESECGRTWSDDPESITQTRRVDPSGRVVLPRPVATVDAVYTLELDGTPSAQALSGWRFDGIDSVWLTPFNLLLNSPESMLDGDRGDTVQITWTPAAATVPAAVTAVAIAVAARMQANPAGASSLSIDDYSQGFSGGNAGPLLPSERAILARYRSRAISSQGVTAL